MRQIGLALLVIVIAVAVGALHRLNRDWDNRPILERLDAIERRLDERADGPTKARPGTARKLDALAYRHVRGVELHQEGDAAFGEEGE